MQARVSRKLLDRLERLPQAVRDIAWKAQLRLCQRYRRLAAAGKPKGNGCAERFIRTLKENLLWVRRLTTIGELRQALHAFKDTPTTGPGSSSATPTRPRCRPSRAARAAPRGGMNPQRDVSKLLTATPAHESLLNRRLDRLRRPPGASPSCYHCSACWRYFSSTWGLTADMRAGCGKKGRLGGPW
jgi:hypothetical protein